MTIKAINASALALSCAAAVSVAVPGAPAALVAYGIVCIACSVFLSAAFGAAALAETVARAVARAD